MKVFHRPRGKVTSGSYLRRCETPGCNRSARCEAVLLGTEHVLLCTPCAKVWQQTYDRALFGWPDEVGAPDPDSENADAEAVPA